VEAAVLRPEGDRDIASSVKLEPVVPSRFELPAADFTVRIDAEPSLLPEGGRSTRLGGAPLIARVVASDAGTALSSNVPWLRHM